MNRLRIVVAGYFVRCPLGGYAWQVLHYLLGFQALGHDVWFYEDSGYFAPAYDPQRHAFEPVYDYGVQAAARFFEPFGLGDRWVFVDCERGRTSGRHGTAVSSILRDADLLVNLGGVNRLPPEERAGRASLFIDLDPAYTQLRLDGGDQGLRTLLDEHTVLFTIGENIGTPRSPIPTGGYCWHATRQPVVMSLWEKRRPPGRAYTTVGKWDAPGRDMIYRGETFAWRKRTEFLRCVDLPRRTGATFELAMDVHGTPGDAALLTANGWCLTDPLAVSTDAWIYRDYLCASRGEFTVAKDMNVRLRSGWLGDRTACYLAAGRPAVEQDTAFGDVLPLGPGLHAFLTVEEAAAAIHAIEADYARASAHASAVAHECFAAEKVLADLLRVGGA